MNHLLPVSTLVFVHYLACLVLYSISSRLPLLVRKYDVEQVVSRIHSNRICIFWIG